MVRQSATRAWTKGSQQVVGHVLLATTAILWGSSYTATRLVVGEVPPLLLGTLRGLLATVVLGAAAWWAGERLWVPRRTWVALAGLGALGVGYFYLGLNLALQWTTATTASLLSLPYPALTALGGWLFLKERLRPTQVAGIGLAAVGATWLTLATAQEGVGGAWFGNLLALSITVAWTIYTLLGRRILPHLSALTATFHMMLAGTLLLALGAGVEFLCGARPDWTVETILVTLYLGGVCTGLGYAFWNRGLSLVPAAAASTYLYLQPVTVLLLAIPLLGEQPTLRTIAAGALVIAGTALAARPTGGD
ncbi:DMT family transporter [Thermomicrobium sp. CFH 73360]|uniref:DMT family transporter n=1 Tax=Thermomicrobium sp. CFH 73360 TaxID=2951987 RepID=UPI00207719A8|nr:DMT family transporter [Thermomicrobium sp. CFH 73360]MCM8746366.1 DMT family transporter [Thermomicrobium sp. CFH 73360]